MDEKESSIFSIKSLCRTCAMDTTVIGVPETDAIDIFAPLNECSGSPKIFDILTTIQPEIKITQQDDLPKTVCRTCIQQLQQVHDFMETYKQANKNLLKLLKAIDSYKLASLEIEAAASLDDEVHSEIDAADTSSLTKNNEIEILDSNLITNTELLHESGVYNASTANDNEAEATTYIDNHGVEEKDIPEIELSDSDECDKSSHIENHRADDEKSEKMIEINSSDSESNEGHNTLDESNNSTIGIDPLPNNIEESIEKDSFDDRKQFCYKGTTYFLKTDTEKKKRFECGYCGREFAKRYRLNDHLLTHSDERPHVCTECGKAFKVKYYLHAHMLVHKGIKRIRPPRKKAERKHPCPQCGKKFAKPYEVNIHMRIHSGETPFLCTECGKTFKAQANLNAHMRRHSGEKKEQCPVCLKKFVDKSDLHGHMFVHKTEKPFVCDTCGLAFNKSYLLKNHSFLHTGIKNFVCVECDQRFARKTSLDRHTLTHTGEKPHGCHYCDRAFLQRNDLFKHMKLHVGENVHLCEFCPLRLPTIKEINAHILKHTMDDEETRKRYLEARKIEVNNLKINYGYKRE